MSRLRLVVKIPICGLVYSRHSVNIQHFSKKSPLHKNFTRGQTFKYCCFSFLYALAMDSKVENIGMHWKISGGRCSRDASVTRILLL